MSAVGKVFEAGRLPLPLELRADLCVVGSGPGGMSAAMVAAEAGLSVVVLEAGALLDCSQMTQREEEMLPRLFWDGANRMTEDRAVRIHQGHGVGGSSVHNICLCKRVPEAIRDHWQKSQGLQHLPQDRWNQLYDEVERLLSVGPVAEPMKSRHNRLLEEGCRALGWKGAGLSHNRTGCLGSGFCEVGCRYDAKNNATKVLLPRALRAGAQVLSGCQATRVVHRGGKVEAVEAVAIDPQTQRPSGRLRVLAPRVCLSASATSTAALLLRSNVPDPSGQTGNGLRIHPAVVVGAEFDDEIRAWEGIPQSFECTEFLQLDRHDGHRVWIVPAFAHPVGAATMIPGLGAMHWEVMRRYGHLAVLTAMIHDLTPGQVRPKGDLGLSLRYWPDAGDRAELALGAWACAKLLFAAGARRVFVPTRAPLFFERGDSIDALRELPIVKGDIDVVAVHPMSTVPMGDDPRRAPVGSDGRHHHLQGLWVADGSLFPTSIGVPPQISIYALGLHVGRAIAAAR